MAIVGAGFTGLTAALRLLQKGQQVTVFERENFVGGLATGFWEKGWEWPLEMHYHHIFETDKYIRQLADEIGHPYKFYDVVTSSVFGDENLEYYRLDSPVSLLKFDKLSVVDRVRMGAVLAYMRYAADWKKLDKQPAEAWLVKMMGQTGYETVWQPLMNGKFGKYQNEVNAAWFWARIKARSQKLGYFEGGFLGLANRLADAVRTSGGKINLECTIYNLKVKGSKWIVNDEDFDRVIVASTANVLLKLVPDLPASYKAKLTGMKGVGTVNVILRLKEEFLPNNIYWLNIHIKDWPMLAIVEHTHMIDRRHYNDEHLIYVAKYLPADDEHMKWSDEHLIEWYRPYLTMINSGWDEHMIGYKVFRAPFTQPVMPVGARVNIPPFETGLPGLYMAGMQQVYPWDRGTNFAVELGERVAKFI